MQAVDNEEVVVSHGAKLGCFFRWWTGGREVVNLLAWWWKRGKGVRGNFCQEIPGSFLCIEDDATADMDPCSGVVTLYGGNAAG